MKRVSHTLTYPGATVEHVYAMLADPTYRKAVSDYQRVTDFACDISVSGGGMTVRLEQAYGTDRIPSFAQKLVGEEIRFVQDESWSSPAGADVQAAIPGKPGDISGTVALDQSGEDVVQLVDLGVQVPIPLLGGKFEGLIADFLRKAFAAENKVGVRWLRGEWRS
jgi:hypothetical protein